MTGYESKRAAAQDKLAQPAQEPVVQCLEAIMELADKYADAMERGPFSRLYQGNIQDARANLQAAVEKIVTPPQRPWVDLTDAEKDGKRLLENGLLFNAAEVQAWELGVEYAEAKLKEKNNG